MKICERCGTKLKWTRRGWIHPNLAASEKCKAIEMSKGNALTDFLFVFIGISAILIWAGMAARLMQ